MPVLDYKEIPEAHKGSGEQDTFELFARDFLSFMGYTIVEYPNRGSDGGVDLIVSEKRIGIGGETVLRWLVSCKHKAHSGSSVSPSVETNISDRVLGQNCQGFIAFYSTLPSSGLSRNFKNFQDKFEIQTFDKEEIEKYLLGSSKGIELAKRYFPISYSRWSDENPKPVELFYNKKDLQCDVCKKNLLNKDYQGIITMWYKNDLDDSNIYIDDIVLACKGHCDNVVQSYMNKQDMNPSSMWEDVSDLMIPTLYLQFILKTMNGQYSNDVKFSQKAYEKLKIIVIGLFPYVSRHQTKEEIKRIEMLLEIPEVFGGLGN